MEGRERGETTQKVFEKPWVAAPYRPSSPGEIIGGLVRTLVSKT